MTYVAVAKLILLACMLYSLVYDKEDECVE